MLVYDVLATLWETTSTDLEIAHAVEVRSGAQISRNIVNQHIRLLLNTGHITAKNANGLTLTRFLDHGGLSKIGLRMRYAQPLQTLSAFCLPTLSAV